VYNKKSSKCSFKKLMRIKWIVIALLCASLLPFSARASAAAPPPPVFQEADIVPGELIVIMQAGSNLGALNLPDQARASAQKHSGLEKLNAGIVQVPAGEEAAYILKLKKQNNVLVVEPNYRVRADLYPNDPAYPSQQYGPALIQAESAWDTTTGSNSVILAIIDSGLDTSHPEFFGRTVAGYNFIDNNTNTQDEYGHGTHVAGIAAATGNNAQGIAGLAWGVKIMPLRVLDKYGNGDYAHVADALMWAVDHGAKIMNLSFGGPYPSVTLENAIYYAYSHGAAIFAAAGNYGTSPDPLRYSVFYPAAYQQVMAVGSVGASAVRSSLSNYGTEMDLMAPGETIYSTMPMTSYTIGKATQYDTLSGTSMAAPHAAGAAALLASLACFDTPDKIYQALEDSARDLGPSGWDQYNGYGLIQVADAMALCPTTPSGAPFAVQYDLLTSQNCNPLVSYNWLAASGGGASVGDSGSTLISLPFTFDFGGQPYTSIRAHANGYISLGNHNTDPTDNNFQSNFSLPTAAKPDNFIAPFWDDLTDNFGAGRIYTTAFGAPPNRQFVIEYRNFKRSSDSGGLNFEVILFEGNNRIEMQYRALSGTGSDGSSATVGLEYGDIFSGLAGYEYSYNQVGALKNGVALLFIPYVSGSPTLPSDSVCAQTQAVTLEKGIGTACDGSPAPFDIKIAAGVLPYRTTLKIQQLNTAPSSMTKTLLDLHHYADIQLAYAPPAPTLYPMPQAYVCYSYTAQDVLAAGGHPENLFITAHDESTNQWQPLTTDLLNGMLVALAPHFSYYGVATFNTTSAASGKLDEELGLPVTGSSISREFFMSLLALGGGLIFLLSGIWLHRKNNRKQRR
jgi:thermitase